MRIASAVSPMMMGRIAVGLLEHVEPGFLDLLAGGFDVVLEPLVTRSGSSIRISIALAALHAMVQGRALLKSVGRPRWMSSSQPRRGARDESARAAAEGLAERAGEEIDLADVVAAVPVGALAEHAEVFVGAAAGSAHDAVPVGVVDDEHGVVLVAQSSDGGEVGDVALHAEDAVGDDPDLAGDVGVGAGGFELVAEVGVVGVLVDALLDALLDRAGELDAVDDARVVERRRRG
jgi:hypothetical protein